MKQSFIIFSLILSLIGSIAISAQTVDQIAVSAKQVLTRSDVDTLVEFYEWAFEARFTPQQRQQFSDSTATEFKADPIGSRKTIDQTIANMTKIRSISIDTQQKVREAFLADFLPTARKDKDPSSRMLLQIYDDAHTATAAKETGADDVSASSPARGNVAQLTGKWVWANSGSTTMATSGAYIGSNGSRHTYEFSANGDVEYTGIMNVMSGACRMQIFKTSRGKASLVGDKLTVSWQPSTFSRDDSCTPAQNYKKTLPAETEVFQIGFKTDYGQRQLCMTQENETCYSPTDK